MQGLWPTLLAILVYLSSIFGGTPTAGGLNQSSSSAGVPAASVPGSVAYPGATEVMAYYAERARGDQSSYLSLNKAAGALTTVIPFSYRVDASGRITGAVNQRMLTLARARGLKVLALVHNAGTGEFDPGAAHSLLSSELYRRRAIEGLYSILVKTGLDGVNLDLENVPPQDRQNLTAFVRELSARLRPQRFLVTASLPAKTYDDRGSVWAGAYDYAALNIYLDQAILMAYDEHVAGGEPGPVASLGWVDSVVRYAVKFFPRQKIVLGLPAYGYVWSKRGSWAIDFAQAASLMAGRRINPSWDSRAQVPYFYYQKAGVLYQVYYENNRSAAAKASLARRYGLRGVAVWRLGYEDPALWQTLAAKLA